MQSLQLSTFVPTGNGNVRLIDLVVDWVEGPCSAALWLPPGLAECSELCQLWPHRERITIQASVKNVQHVYAVARTEEEKIEWLKVLEDTIRDSLKRRFSFNVGGLQPRTPNVNVSESWHYCRVFTTVVAIVDKKYIG